MVIQSLKKIAILRGAIFGQICDHIEQSDRKIYVKRPKHGG